MDTNLPPMLNLLATEANGTTYDHNSLAYMSFVIREASDQDRETLRQCLRGMKYNRFLKTVYWAIIKARIVAIQPMCQRCRLKRSNFIHHRNYFIHGLEHEHVDSLVGLCGDCHQREHDLLPPLSGEVREQQARIPNSQSNRGGLTHISDFIRNMK